MVNYGKKLVYVDGVKINPLISTNGHYMINIFDDLNNILHVKDLYYKLTVSDETEVYLDTVISDDISDEELDFGGGRR
jgi:hypothetical protein